MLEATIQEASTLKRLLDAVKELVTDGNFECNDEGIHLQAMDNSHVALVSASLRSEGFSNFRCDRPITLGVNLASLTKVIKCAKDDDEVRLTAADSADNLQLVYNSKASDRVAQYDVKLMDIDQETLTIPDTDYDATVSMSSAEFARLCRDLGALGESVAIEVTKEGVRFSCEGDAANGTVLLKADSSGGRHSGGSSSKMKIKKEEDEDARMDEDASEDDGGEKEDEDEDDEEETSKKRKRSKASSEKAPKGKAKKARKTEEEGDVQGVQLVMSQHVALTFSIKYLLNFAKSANLCNRVTLSLSNDVPLMVQYDFGQGVIKYFLAPKLTDS